MQRAGNACELCSSALNLGVYEVSDAPSRSMPSEIIACEKCLNGLSQEEIDDVNHWRCLNESMWSTVPAVQVVAYRMLSKIRSEGWPQDLLDMMYLEEEVLTWAKKDSEVENKSILEKKSHIDSNGVELSAGDSVVLIKDLKVKGASFVAKRGTAVRNISLVHDNPAHIEGKVNGQQIVILTEYVKK